MRIVNTLLRLQCSNPESSLTPLTLVSTRERILRFFKCDVTRRVHLPGCSVHDLLPHRWRAPHSMGEA